MKLKLHRKNSIIIPARPLFKLISLNFGLFNHSIVCGVVCCEKDYFEEECTKEEEKGGEKEEKGEKRKKGLEKKNVKFTFWNVTFTFFFSSSFVHSS